MTSKKPFIITSLGISLLLIWNMLGNIHWGSVGGCVAGYMATDWLTSLMSGN